MKLSSRAIVLVRCVLVEVLCSVLAACGNASALDVDLLMGSGTYQSRDELSVLRGYWYKLEGEVTGLQQLTVASLSLMAPDEQVLKTEKITLIPETMRIYGPEGANANTDGGLASGQYKATLELLGRTYTETVTVDGNDYLDFVTGLTVQNATTAAISISWDAVPGAKLYEAVLWRPGEGGSVFATTATAYTFESDAVELVANTEYWVSVRAYSEDTRTLERSQEIRSSEIEGPHFTLSEAALSR